jgi:hypothetical protein
MRRSFHAQVFGAQGFGAQGFGNTGLRCRIYDRHSYQARIAPDGVSKGVGK